MNGNIKLGKLLCDQDIITKRQLNKALQAQVKGDKRTIGEILVDMNFCEFDDITDVLMNSSEDTKHHEEKTEEIHPEPVVKEEPKKEPTKKEPIELSEDKVLDTKFTLSVQTMVALGTGMASLIGMWFALQADIEEAKLLPEPEISRTEYDLKDQLIRETIMSTQEKVEENSDKLDKIDEKLYEIIKK